MDVNDIRQQINDALIKELQEAIDREVMDQVSITIFENRGWFKVNCYTPIEDIGSWMDKNVKDNWRSFGHVYLFENHDEATLFRLTWI